MFLKYCTCARETSWVKQLAGEECKIVFSAWACKHIYYWVFCGIMYTQLCVKNV